MRGRSGVMAGLMGLLAGCGGAAKGGATEAMTLADYAGAPGTLLLYAPAGEPEAATIMLQIRAAEWEIRDGDFWRDAPPGEVLPWTAEADLVVGEDVLLPGGLTKGAGGGEAVISAEGEAAVWYGTFPDVLTVEIAGGAWRGTAAFAAGVGPIRFARDGDWELVGYERDTGDTGDTGDGGG